MPPIPPWVWWILAALNVIAFLLAINDKMRARRSAHRIPERTLLGVALIGGSVGLLTGMVLARHKVRKPSFLGRLLFVVLVQAAIVVTWYLTS